MYKQTKAQMSMDTKTNGQITATQGRLVADMQKIIAQKGITQAQMAAQIGLSGGTMSELLNGKGLSRSSY